MIIADATIWTAALEGRDSALNALLSDLWSRKEVSAPPVVFAEMLQHVADDRDANQIRSWAADAPPLNETPMAWLASGDMGGHLRQRGVILGMTDLYVIALCIREGAQLWTRNAAVQRAAPGLPIHFYAPQGVGDEQRRR